jgi:hypothetical protein
MLVTVIPRKMMLGFDTVVTLGRLVRVKELKKPDTVGARTM